MEDLQIRLTYKKDDADDWTKVEDKALRKTIQNRLAKRKSRKNGSKGKLSKTSITEAALRAQFESQSTQSITNSTTTSTALNLCLNSFGHSLSTGSAITPKSGDEPLFASFFATPGLAEHHYFRLTQYSLLRAFVLNTTILGLDPSYLGNDDSLSPFTVINPCPRPTPEDLTPTSIQLSTPHHPYLDILSPPKFRDGVLLSLMNDDLEDQLCHELHSGGFTIWGSQPWNAFAWEISQAFAMNWVWLVDESLIRSSNFWRGERGEPPLVMPDLGGGVIGEVF